MQSFTVKDVNEALPLAMMILNGRNTTRKPSRAGEVIEVNEAVSMTYRYPMQRVLFNEARDANPFFHFMEGLWMLAGRDDVEWICEYNKNLKQFSDDGAKFHGAYGFRIRKYWDTVFADMDQLNHVIAILKRDPNERRAVVQIWRAEYDLSSQSKDIPCNDIIFFKIRNNKLHMTVCCRSNDAIWGAYGANAVHFSMIMEYVASMIGVDVGTYTQVSDSLHVYTDNPQWGKLREMYYNYSGIDAYQVRDIKPYPMVKKLEMWDVELTQFMGEWDVRDEDWQNPFYPEVAMPMRKAWRTYKNGDKQLAHMECNNILADDWRIACSEWIRRRIIK